MATSNRMQSAVYRHKKELIALHALVIDICMGAVLSTPTITRYHLCKYSSINLRSSEAMISPKQSPINNHHVSLILHKLMWPFRSSD